MRSLSSPQLDLFTHHRWSGWPGAYCMYCGADDPVELALADGFFEGPDFDEAVKANSRPCISAELQRRFDLIFNESRYLDW